MQRPSVVPAPVRRVLTLRWKGVAVGLMLAAALAAILAFWPALKRRGLWAVVNLCVADHRVTGLAWPCLSVETTPGGREIVVLQAPLEPGHILVVPTQRIAGLESPELAGEPGIDYLEAAWGLRDRAAAHVGGGGSWADFGIVINGPWQRTQKQLHVHVECLFPRAASALASMRTIPTASWVPLEGYRRTFVRRWPQADLKGLDFRRDLYHAMPLPADRDESRINLGAAGTLGPDGQREFLLLYSTGRSLEYLLDRHCGLLRDRAGPGG